MKRNICILLCIFFCGIVFSDTSSLEYIQQQINFAITDEGRTRVIEVCEKFDTMVIDTKTRETLIEWLENIYYTTTGDKEINAACFLLYFGKDYSDYLFVLFRYFYTNGYHERYHLEITQLVGTINTIHAANAKICIVNSDTTEDGHIYDLLNLYVGMSSKYYLYIYAHLKDWREATNEAMFRILSTIDKYKDQKDKAILDLLESCDLLLDNIDETIFGIDWYLAHGYHPADYFIRIIYPQVVAVINYLDPAYLSHETMIKFKRMWFLAIN